MQKVYWRKKGIMIDQMTNEEHHEYLVTRGFLKRIKEAIETGIYPDKERGDQLVETLEQKIKDLEKCDTN